MPLAILRTPDWETSLFFHVLGAMLLVGSLVVVVTALLVAWRRDDRDQEVPATRFAFRALLFAVLPSFILMRVAAEWVQNESPFDDDAGWIGVGYITSDLGVPLFIIATVLSGLGLRRLGRDGGPTLGRIAALVAAIMLGAFVVAIWAMTTKPE